MKPIQTSFRNSQLSLMKQHLVIAEIAENFTLTAEKKRNYLETKLTENIELKELWKTLKALRLPNKVSIATINALKDNKVVKYDPKSISKVSQTFFANMAKTLLQNLPLPPNKYGIDSVKNFCKDLNILNNSN